MKKKAVVLLITLGFISLIFLLVQFSLKLSKDSFDSFINIKQQNQMILILNDFKEIFANFKKDDLKNNFIDQGTFPISDNKTNLNLTISCKSLDQRLNLNKIILCKTKLCKEIDILKNFANIFNLSDPDFFVALLKDTVNPLQTERMSGSKIYLDNPKFSQGCIINYQTIKEIKKKYFHETKDEKIFNMTKDKFLDTFYLTNKNIDTTKVSTPTDLVAKTLGCLENDDYCLDLFKKLNLDLKKTPNCKKNKKNKLLKINNLVECQIDLFSTNKTNNIIFKYDLKEKRVVNIDEFF